MSADVSATARELEADAACDVCADIDVARFQLDGRPVRTFCGRCGRRIPVVQVDETGSHPESKGRTR